MSKQKRYTAQEMREKVKAIELIPMMGLELTSSEKLELAAMLRQAADAEEDLAKLKARLEAVVKECEKQIPACRGEDCKCNPTDSGYCDENCHDEIIVHTAVTAILRVARGDAGKGKTRVNDSSDAS